MRSFLLLVAVIIGSALTATFLLHFISENSTQNPVIVIENVEARSEQEEISVGLPARITIPEINVDAAVEHVGLTPDGNMDVPKDPGNAGWYKRGQRPGENGSAVIAGHYGRWENGQRSVFDNLHKLQKGDTVFVTDDSGVTTTFVVRESRKYDPEANADDVFRSRDGGSHLNLITCEGDWNEGQAGYSDRLVIFTDQETEIDL